MFACVVPVCVYVCLSVWVSCMYVMSFCCVVSQSKSIHSWHYMESPLLPSPDPSISHAFSHSLTLTLEYSFSHNHICTLSHMHITTHMRLHTSHHQNIVCTKPFMHIHLQKFVSLSFLLSCSFSCVANTQKLHHILAVFNLFFNYFA